MFDDIPIAHKDRDAAWAAFIKRKDVQHLMTDKKDFEFPLDGSYDIWCICWDKAWTAGFKAGWEGNEK